MGKLFDDFRNGLSAPFSLFELEEEELENGFSLNWFGEIKEPFLVKRTKFSTWEDSWNKIGRDMQRAIDYVGNRIK
jgi:hypothetical protein